MMTSSNGNIFRVTGPLYREFIGHLWIPLTKASDAELWCFLWSAPWINGWVNNREASDLRRHHAHYDAVTMLPTDFFSSILISMFKIEPMAFCFSRNTTQCTKSPPEINLALKKKYFHEVLQSVVFICSNWPQTTQVSNQQQSMETGWTPPADSWSKGVCYGL